MDLKMILEECIKILDERGKSYGEIAFVRAAEIASAMEGKVFTPSDVAICLFATKIARLLNMPFTSNVKGTDKIEMIKNNRKDSIIDAVNYLILHEREAWKFSLLQEKKI